MRSPSQSAYYNGFEPTLRGDGRNDKLCDGKMCRGLSGRRLARRRYASNVLA